jgi:hypothetical protein
MSKIALSGNASGTGTFTIASPNSNTDRTLTLPDNSGTVITTGSTFAGTGPAFSASRTATQSVASNTVTKVQLVDEQFDTNNAFDNVTNYRFTPAVAGYYQFSHSVRGIADGGTLQAVNSQLFKNGSELLGSFVTGSFVFQTTVTEANSTGSLLVYLNGSTDYVELYGKVIGTSTSFLSAYLTGALVRAA